MDDSQTHLLCKRYQSQKVTNGDSSAVEKAKTIKTENRSVVVKGREEETV